MASLDLKAFVYSPGSGPYRLCSAPERAPVGVLGKDLNLTQARQHHLGPSPPLELQGHQARNLRRCVFSPKAAARAPSKTNAHWLSVGTGVTAVVAAAFTVRFNTWVA